MLTLEKQIEVNFNIPEYVLTLDQARKFKMTLVTHGKYYLSLSNGRVLNIGKLMFSRETLTEAVRFFVNKINGYSFKPEHADIKHEYERMVIDVEKVEIQLASARVPRHLLAY